MCLVVQSCVYPGVVLTSEMCVCTLLPPDSWGCWELVVTHAAVPECDCTHCLHTNAGSHRGRSTEMREGKKKGERKDRGSMTEEMGRKGGKKI